jgi:signal transduction histidine kinase
LNAMQTIGTMQFPVVLLLVLLTVSAAKTFRSQAYGLFAAGWSFNFLYLLTKASPAGVSLVGALELPCVVASSVCMWMGARKVPRDIFPVRGPTSPMVIVGFAGVVIGADLGVRAGWPLALAPWLGDLLRYGLRAVFNWISIAYMAAYMYRTDAKWSSQKQRGESVLFVATIAYAWLQFLRLIAGSPGDLQHTVVITTGLAVGLVLKGAMIVGLVGLFASAAADARESVAKLKATRETVETIAHELGTPVSQMIVNIARMTKDQSGQGRALKSLLTVENALFRVEAIISATKDFPLLQMLLNDPAGIARERLEPRRLSINSIVQTAIMAVKQTRDEDVHYRIQYRRNLCVFGNLPELVQVFINILRNSCDALRDGKGTITVETYPSDDADATREDVCVRVGDSGEGIAPEVLPKLFIERVSTRGTVGRGLGLGVVSDIVERYGGNVELRNANGSPEEGAVGAVAIVRLPRVKCVEEERRNA